MARTLIVYQRERSAVWQCRYRVNRRWQRASTGEHELPKAIAKAHKMYITAEVRHSQGLPVVTRRVKHVAALAIKRMEDELAIGQGKVSYETYIRIINDFILPTIGRREITSITPTVSDFFIGLFPVVSVRGKLDGRAKRGETDAGLDS